MEKDQQYGWKLSKKYGIYNSLSFNCGPTIYFQMYNKAVSNLQAATIHEIFADEELPMHFYDELMFRLTTTEGIFSTGFTPTLNQLFWREAMNTDKNLPHALKLCVSMYDCLKYEDGSPSRIMTLDKIKLAESRCSSETEKQRRVFGKFVTEEGRSYFAFDFDKHVVPPKKITGWQIVASVDYGSGEESGIKKTKKNHPAAILFLAVRDDYKKGAVFKCWRGDSQKTTAGDIYNRYADMVKDMAITTEVYDASSADFGTIATRNGRGFVPANKSRDAGEDLVNTLFKHGMLEIYDDDAENMKLASELMSMMLSNQRGDHKKEDDLADALRYAVMAVPWDLTAIINKEDDTPRITRPLSDKELLEMQIEERRGNGRRYKEESSDWAEMENDFAYWNSEYEGF
jgi:phage terminase large subunit-like protein